MSRVVAVGSDHAGFEVKPEIIAFIKTLPDVGEVVDMGPFQPGPVDYPEYAEKVATAVASKKADVGVIMCGTGIGVSIAANKVHNVRAALCHDRHTASTARQHNNANVVCFGVRLHTMQVMQEILEGFLATPFEGGRHEKRVNLIHEVEQRNAGAH